MLQERGLVHRHRNCHWHSKRKLHTSSWGQITWPNPHTMRPFKQENAGMKSRASLVWSSVMQISILTHHALWRYNRRIMKLLLPISTASKQQLSSALLIMTLWQSIFLLKYFRLCTPLQLKFTKGPSNFVWSHQIGWKIQCSTTTNGQADTLHGQYDV